MGTATGNSAAGIGSEAGALRIGRTPRAPASPKERASFPVRSMLSLGATLAMRAYLHRFDLSGQSGGYARSLIPPDFGRHHVASAHRGRNSRAAAISGRRPGCRDGGPRPRPRSPSPPGSPPLARSPPPGSRTGSRRRAPSRGTLRRLSGSAPGPPRRSAGRSRCAAPAPAPSRRCELPDHQRISHAHSVGHRARRTFITTSPPTGPSPAARGTWPRRARPRPRTQSPRRADPGVSEERLVGFRRLLDMGESR
jgi:hypothetical protein